MTAYMSLNGVPATANKWLISDVLRDSWGFKGWVVSDSGAVRSLETQGVAADSQGAAVHALKAGVDMEMARVPEPATMQDLPAALGAGRIDRADLDNAVRRVLAAKIRMGLFENPYVAVAKAEAVLNNPARRMARLAAERSAVLLRNENGLLPMDRRTIKSLAVIGPLADAERDTLGPWVFKPTRPTALSVLSGLRAKLGQSVHIEYSEGVRMPPRLHPSPMARMDQQPARPPLDESAEIQRAVKLANDADVTVLVLGEAQEMIGEAASRSTLELPGRQQELLDAVVATGKPVVLLLMNARPLDLKDTKAAAILEMWYPGSEGGPAAANLLFGDAVPGGKLPFTWIRSAAHAPLNYAHLISHKPKDADTRYWNESSEPLYPFGHGLSYTTFQYSNLRVERASYAPEEAVHMTVDLKNTGTRAAEATRSRHWPAAVKSGSHE